VKSLDDFTLTVLWGYLEVWCSYLTNVIPMGTYSIIFSFFSGKVPTSTISLWHLYSGFGRCIMYEHLCGRAESAIRHWDWQGIFVLI